MAMRHQAQDEVPQAELRIPTEWLMPWLDLEAVRQAQRPDTDATMTAEFLTLSGVELTSFNNDFTQFSEPTDKDVLWVMKNYIESAATR